MSLTAILLGLCQFFYLAAIAVSFSFTGLVGERLTGTSTLATLPFLVMTGITAIMAMWLPRLITHLGYRTVFIAGCLAGVAGAGLSTWAIVAGSFVCFCFASAGFGIYQASALYYRFAAADTVAPAARGRAIAWVMSGGIPAALFGPLLGAEMLHLLPVAYSGSFLAAAGVALLALPTLAFANFSDREPAKALRNTTQNLSLTALLHYPNATSAIVFCVGGYAVMMLVMLAAPLAMSNHGHTAADAASVIQWHLLGMFGPSLLTGKLIDRFTPRAIAFLGCVVLAVGCGTALLDATLDVYHSALLLIGMGWNFAYMGGTTLLTQMTDLPIRARLQALNESLTFVVMTVTAGMAGWLYQGIGWNQLIAVALLLVLAMALSAATLRQTQAAA